MCHKKIVAIPSWKCEKVEFLLHKNGTVWRREKEVQFYIPYHLFTKSFGGI